MRGVWQVDLLRDGAELLGQGDRPFERPADAGFDFGVRLTAPRFLELGGYTKPQAVEAFGAAAGRSARGSRSEVASQGSWPTIWPSSRAASATVRVSGPAWSSEEANAIIP